MGKISLGLAMGYVSMLASTDLAHAQRSAQVAQATASMSWPHSLGASESARLSAKGFTQINHVETFPTACKEAFGIFTKEPAFLLADPQQPFQATDVVSPAKLPWRRLILGGISSDLCVIYYEKGGFTTSYAAVVIDISETRWPTVVWSGVGGSDVPGNITELIDLITKGGFRQGDRNSW
jgi:hypothetical protein